MKKKTILALVLFAIITISLPLAMDWLIVGNDIPSNVSNSDWVNFFGGYIGAILGSIVSLIGIIATIRYTNRQNKIDRELQIRPYCVVRYVNKREPLKVSEILAGLHIIPDSFESNSIHDAGVIFIKNIGVGPAIEFEFSVNKIRDNPKLFLMIEDRTSSSSVNALLSGSEAAFPICISGDFDPIREEDFIDTGDTGEDGMYRFRLKEEVMLKYRSFDIVINMKYKDMYHNQYYQQISLFANMSVRGRTGEKCEEHVCSISLKEVTNPVRGKQCEGC